MILTTWPYDKLVHDASANANAIKITLHFTPNSRWTPGASRWCSSYLGWPSGSGFRSSNLE